MKLSRYLKITDTSQAEFARLIGVSRQRLLGYVNGTTIPRTGPMADIVNATEGAVQPNDFYDLPKRRKKRVRTRA